MGGIGASARVFEVINRTPAIPDDLGLAIPPDRRGFVSFGFEYPSRKGVEILKDFHLEMAVSVSIAIV